MKGLLVALSLVASGPLVAQETADVLIEGRASRVRVVGSAASAGGPLTGHTVGVGVLARWWWLTIEPRYHEGTVTADAGGVRWDVIAGEVMFGLRPVRWFTFSAGPLITSYLTPEGTRRTVAWHGRVRLEAILLVRGLRSYMDLWRVMSADANTVQLVDGGYGGEAGLRVRFPGTPVALGASYRVERTDFGGGLWLETVEHVGLSLGVAFGKPPL